MKHSLTKRPRFALEYVCLAVIAVVLLVYTVLLLLISEELFYSWINSLLTTVLSVLAAFLIGLFLYDLQVRRADEKRREELTELVLGELEEIRESLKDSSTNVPKEALEEFGSVEMASIHLTVHYPNSVLVQDAARSGLFDVEKTRALMLLAQDMDNHVRFVDHTSRLEPALEEAMASATLRQSSKAVRWAGGMLRRYAQAVRMVQRSEKSILGRCENVEEVLVSRVLEEPSDDQNVE